MPNVVLSATGKKDVILSYKYTIKSQQYDPCLTFIRYEHKLGVQLTSEDICVYKNDPNTSSNFVTLTPGSKYNSAFLETAHVYYNKVDDSHSHPLLLVLFFKGDSSTINKYYLRSVFETDISSKGSKGIDKLINYTDERGILNALIEENDGIDGVLTFLVDITTERDYNRLKINVSRSELKGSSEQSNAFYKYFHKPTNSECKSKACILYKQQVLLRWDHGKIIQRMVPIDEIQNVKVCNMAVYYSPKNSEPLLVEFLIEKEGKKENSYYFQKVSSGGLYWQLLNETSSSSLLGTSYKSDQIHTKLTEESNKLLLKALNKIDEDLIKVVMVLVDKRSDYQGMEVNETLKTVRLGTGDLIANSNGKIKVSDISSNKCKSIRYKGYSVYEHDFGEVIGKYKPTEAAIMKIILSSKETIGNEGNILTIILDYHHEHGSYRFHSHLILVSDFYNRRHKYKWYNHAGEHEIIDGTFQLQFNGQFLTIEGDLGNSSHNKSVIVYYYSEYRDRFLLVAFPDKTFRSPRYMTYFEFIEKVSSRSTVKLTELKQMQANIKNDRVDNETGYNLDGETLLKLQEVYQKLKSDSNDCINSLDIKKDKHKLYVYSSKSDPRTLMICYDDKAYTRHFLGRKNSKWKQFKGITKCGCSDNVDIVVQELNRLASFHGLTDSQKPPVQGELVKRVSIDISKKGRSSYNDATVNVTDRILYDNSNLFRYYTHSLEDETPFKISSLTASGLTKTINLSEDITVKSIEVYFNVYFTQNPLIMCIKTNNGACKYYDKLVQQEPTYEISENSIITSSNLTDILIEESERINETWIYHLDNIVEGSASNDYGHDKGIKVTKAEKSRYKFTTYTHVPSKKKLNEGFILYKKCLLVGKSDYFGPLSGIQKKTYNEVIVYILDRDRKVPLMIELKDSKSVSTYFSYKRHETQLYWEKGPLVLGSDDKIRDKLNEIYYHLNSSAIIEIDKGGGNNDSRETTYEMKTINNLVKSITREYQNSSYAYEQLVGSKNIILSQPVTIKRAIPRSNIQFKYFSHDIPQASSLSSPDVNNTVVAGIRLFLRTTNQGNPVELELYPNRSVRVSDRLILYYPLSNFKKLYVYFHGEDPRPLALCYDNQMYRRLNNNNTKWFCTKRVKCSEPSLVFDTLKSIHDSMKVKLTFVSDGQQENINEALTQPLGTFKRDSYTPVASKQTGPFRLPKQKLTERMTEIKIIDKLLDNLHNNTFESINVYYEDKTKPLVFEFVDDTRKTHLQCRDVNSKYWLKETLQYSGNDLSRKLEELKASASNTIIYEIDKKDDPYNAYIKLIVENRRPTDGFDKYTHTPKGDHTSKKSLVLYNLNKLIKKGGGTLAEIQDQTYSNVTVYFGTKAKVGTNFAPLILELNKSSPNHKTHYRLRLKDSLYFWELVTIASEDVKDKDLITKLRETELDLVESLAILLEKNGVSTYGVTEIQKKIKQLTNFKEIKLANIGSNFINVKNASNGSKCMDRGYTIYEHDVSSCIREGKNYAIRFFIFTKYSADEYNEITLYDSNQAFDALYYDKSVAPGKDKVYVFFYDSDPRPLLLCYGGAAYKPKSSDTYFGKWYRDTTINKCQCQTDPDSQNLLKALSKVVKFLNVVHLDRRPFIRFQDYEKPDTLGKDEDKYTVHKFKGKDIYIKVTYQNKNCYRAYIHRPNGNDNKGDGFRLGNLEYNGKPTGINYESHMPLLTVSVYYSVHDGEHEHPFLVALNFKSGGGDTSKEYYELTDNTNKKWVKMSDSDKYIINKLNDDETLENGLYYLRNKLDIKFKDEDKKYIKPLFEVEKCEEDNVDVGTIAGGAAGGLVGVGAIVTISVVVTKKLAFTAVTTVAAAAAAAA